MIENLAALPPVYWLALGFGVAGIIAVYVILLVLDRGKQQQRR